MSTTMIVVLLGDLTSVIFVTFVCGGGRECYSTTSDLLVVGDPVASNQSMPSQTRSNFSR